MKTNYLLILLVFSTTFGFAQTKDSLSVEEKERREKNIQAGNPFKEFGYKAKIATLSKGKYLEFHDLDSIVQVGSVMINTRTNRIVTIIEKDTLALSEATLEPEIISRWMSPDPLSEEFPDKSPYNFVNNNPLRFVDPLGLAPEDLILKFDSEAARNGTQENFDSAFGKNGATIDENGKVTLNVARDDLKTEGQKAFFDVINEASDPNQSDVTINVASGSEEILIGNYETNSIDIQDVNKFGDNDLSNKNSVFAHEVGEQTGKQRNNLTNSNEDYLSSHTGPGFSAENKVSGNIRYSGGTEVPTVGTTAQGRDLKTGKGLTPYYQTSTGQRKNLQVKVRRNNIIRVKTMD